MFGGAAQLFQIEGRNIGSGARRDRARLYRIASGAEGCFPDVGGRIR